MDLKDFKLEKEDAESMHISHPNGKKLILHKASMSEKAKSLIKKMACGGAVGHYDDGGMIASIENAAANVGSKVNNLFGSNKVQQERPTSSGKDYYISDIDRTINKNVADEQAKKQHSSYAGMYASGGEVDNATEVIDDKGYGKIIRVGLADGDGPLEPLMSTISPQPQEQLYTPNPNYEQPQAAAPVAAPQAQAMPPEPMQQAKLSTENLLNKQQKEVQDLGSAQDSAAQAEAGAANDYAKNVSGLSSPEDIQASWAEKSDKLAQGILDKNIDPDRYWHNLSTGSKIRAGIALALGGIGAAYNGGHNYALDIINKSIDADIDSQKQDYNKKMSLWQMNRQAFGDDMRANIATKDQMQTIYQAKLAQAAAMAKAPEAKFHAAQMLNQIEQEKIANRQRLGLLTQGMNVNSGTSSSDPLQLATDTSIVPADRQKEVIDQLGKAAYVAKHQDELLSLYDQAEKENTAMGRAGRLGFEPPSMKALKLLGAPLLKDNDGRVNENAISTFNDILPGPLERDSSGKEKRAAFQKFLQLHSDAPAAKAYGLDPERFKSTTTNPAARLPGDQRQIYDWARANPSNPKAQQALKRFQEMGIK